MAHKVVLINDPGIDGAFAVALALLDPNLEVLGLGATPGNVSADQATQNVHILIEQLDPPRWPRLGEAPNVQFSIHGHKLHGAKGLGNANFTSASLHHMLPGEKMLAEQIRLYPDEVTVICMGPLTVLARTFDMYPELVSMIKRIVCLGGTLTEPGNAGPVNEFHFTCDPASARQVLHCGAPITLIPLDVMRRVLFAPTDLLNLPAEKSKTCKFLRQIIPFGIAATSNLYGVEGFHLKDVLGVIAVSLPQALITSNMRVDVETQGELTRGMSVIDRRTWQQPTPNADVATELEGQLVRNYIKQTLMES